jgi:SET domain-containing protein
VGGAFDFNLAVYTTSKPPPTPLPNQTRHPPPQKSFINHSCDGGTLELVFVTRKGELIPRVALFARRGIASGEELTFSYGDGDSSSGGGEGDGGAAQRRARCACGSAACRGYLPREPV